MKYALAAALLLACSASFAVQGMLVKSEITMTISGKQAWRCTYSVGGNEYTVIVKDICPSFMQFE